MKIGVDLDDVLGEFVPNILKFDREVYGSDFDLHSFAKHRVSSLFELLAPDIDGSLKKLYHFYDSKYFDLVSPVDGARQGVEELISKGHELVVITSRPASIQQKTERWLDENFPGLFSDLFMADKALGNQGPDKPTVCKNLGIGVIIDDFLPFAYECAEKEIDVLLFDSAWNQQLKKHNKITRVKSWKEIVKHIEQKLVIWTNRGYKS
jgi:5'(3')-deoxyribonucleotidase